MSDIRIGEGVQTGRKNRETLLGVLVRVQEREWNRHFQARALEKKEVIFRKSEFGSATSTLLISPPGTKILFRASPSPIEHH